MFYEQRNLGMLERLDAVARERFGKLLVALEEEGDDVLITDGKRSVQEQNALWARGRTAPGNIVTDVRGDESLHVWGMAIDLVPVSVTGGLQYGAFARYQRIAFLAEQLGIRWGYALWGKDQPHFQYTQGLTITHLRTGLRLRPVAEAPTLEELEQRLRVAERALDRASPRRKNLLTRFIKRAAKILRGV